MSWLFGYKSQVPQMGDASTVGGVTSGAGPAPPAGAGAAANDQKLTSAERKAMEAYRFDSSALERAAEAARTLERSSKSLIHKGMVSIEMHRTVPMTVMVVGLGQH